MSQVWVSHRRWNGSGLRHAPHNAGSTSAGTRAASAWVRQWEDAHATAAEAATSEVVRQSPRHTPKRDTDTENAGGACMARARRVDQTRLNTSVPFVPPKPKLFLTAYSIFISRAVLAQ